MDQQLSENSFTSINVIVNHGVSHKVKRIAEEEGAIGCTVLLCRGVASSKVLKTLGIYEMKKELIFILCKPNLAKRIIKQIWHKLNLTNASEGILFSTPICDVIGSHVLKSAAENESHEQKESYQILEKENDPMYDAIYVIVDKGKSIDVMGIATDLGAKGATIFNSRGSGVHETNKLFNMDVEPEKEVILVIADETLTASIASAIVEKIKINEPGNGLLYTQKIENVFGL